MEHADSLASTYLRAYQLAARTLTSPQLEQRKELRRSLQQRGYATALQSCLEGDGLFAMLAILRAHLQVALHIPHTPITLYVPIKQQPSWDEKLPGHLSSPTRHFDITLAEDWSFPDDPWRKP
jgi:hypothetical protein